MEQLTKTQFLLVFLIYELIVGLTATYLVRSKLKKYARLNPPILIEPLDLANKNFKWSTDLKYSYSINDGYWSTYHMYIYNDRIDFHRLQTEFSLMIDDIDIVYHSFYATQFKMKNGKTYLFGSIMELYNTDIGGVGRRAGTSSSLQKKYAASLKSVGLKTKRKFLVESEWITCIFVIAPVVIILVYSVSHLFD